MKKVLENYVVYAIFALAIASVFFIIATLTENAFLALVVCYLLISLLFVGFCLYVITSGIFFIARSIYRKYVNWTENNDLIIRKPIIIKQKKKTSAFITL